MNAPPSFSLSALIAVSATALVMGGAVGFAARSVTNASIPPPDRATAVGTVRAALMRLKNPAASDIFAAEPSGLPGFVEARSRGAMIYVSDDGRYVVRGTVQDSKTGADLSAKAVNAERARAIAGLDPKTPIHFGPANPVATVTVFTDFDCPYCRHFQDQLTQYTDKGIGVAYYPFPLNIHPDAERKAVAVWCAADRPAAFVAAMAGIDPGAATCANPVKASLQTALSVGIMGTPSIVAGDGSMVPPEDAFDADKLLAYLKGHAAAAPPA